MAKRVPVLILVALTAVLLALPAAALAQQPPPPGGPGQPGQPMAWPEALGRFVGIWLSNLAIAIQKSVAAVFWFLAKLACAFSGLLREESLWVSLRESIVGALARVMPGALRSVALGSTGLLYVALMLAGVLMTVPLFGETRLVQAHRVVLWGAVMIALFVNGVFGYDLIGFIEDLRVGAIRSITATMSPGSGIEDLAARPMRATAAEMEALNFSLPAAFEQEFFPEPGEEDYEEVKVVFSGALGFSGTFKMETEESLQDRRARAGDGLGIAFLTLLPAWVVFLFGLIFAFLGAAALLLIVFFVAALPLGFFEFGSTILGGIVQQYVYVFALSLLVAVLVGLLGGVGGQVLPAGAPADVGEMVAFLPALVVVSAMLQYGVKMAWSALTGTAGIMNRAMSAVATMAYAGSPPPPGGSPVSGLAKLAMGAGLAAATGGVGAALLAGAGSLLSGSATGQAAAQVATAAAPESRGAHVFASAVRARGVADTAAGVVATNVRFSRAAAAEEAAARERAGRALVAEVGRESRQVDPRWQAINAGGFLTADLGALRRAEESFFRRKDPGEARRHLEQAFGNREVADEALSLYRRQGRQGAETVRRVAETTQATALEFARQGRPVFNERGESTRAFQDAVRRRLMAAGLHHQADPEVVGRIAGATVRRPTGVWSDPEAPRKLARDTLNPEAPEVAAGDLPAQYRLRDLAAVHGWGERELEQIFAVIPQARAAALRSGGPVEEEAAQILAARPEFENAPLRGYLGLTEAVRLAEMTAEGAEVQRPARVDVEPRAAPLAAGFDEAAYRRGVEAFYDRADPEAARAELVAATGSVRAADRLLEGFERHPRREAEALPDLLRTAQEVPPAWGPDGSPAPEYVSAVRSGASARDAGPEAIPVEVSGTVAVEDAPGAALFDDVADDLLARMDERWAERADVLAGAVLRGRAGGPAAQELREEARRQGWQESDLADLIRRAVAEAMPGAAGGAVEFGGAASADSRLLALTRDALREVERGGAGTGGN